MKSLLRLLAIAALTCSLGSCFIFKKKCDCPKFGKTVPMKKPEMNGLQAIQR